MTDQLTLFTPPTPAPRALRWYTGPVLHEGTERYTHLIRAAGDPERTAREDRPERDGTAQWRRDLNKGDVAVMGERIAVHLGDGVPRTFQRIAVELLDKDADVVFETAFDEALWALVAARRVAFCDEAPVLFTINGGV